MWRVAFEAGLILVLMCGVGLWVWYGVLRCEGCGHLEADHVCGPDGDECVQCDCRRYW